MGLGHRRAGEKPYGCKHNGCNKRFARISDLRSHERTHDANAKVFFCIHPGCGKSFTRPYDLKKHKLNQHQGARAKAMGGTASTILDCGKRGIAETHIALESSVEYESDVGTAAAQQDHRNMESDIFSPETDSHQSIDLVEGVESCTQPSEKFRQSPATAASSHSTRYRKRVRCEAHKYCAPGAPSDAASMSVDASARAHEERVAPGSTSQDIGNASAELSTGSEARAHVHGASCGHVAVLHEDHVDFLMGGQLECFDGKEVSDIAVTASPCCV